MVLLTLPLSLITFSRQFPTSCSLFFFPQIIFFLIFFLIKALLVRPKISAMLLFQRESLLIRLHGYLEELKQEFEVGENKYYYYSKYKKKKKKHQSKKNNFFYGEAQEKLFFFSLQRFFSNHFHFISIHICTLNSRLLVTFYQQQVREILNV